MPFYGTTYLWKSDLVSRSVPSSKNFVYTLRQLLGMESDKKKTASKRERERERERERRFRETGIVVAVTAWSFET